jgi:uncharacterized membrane protein YecN with MAPEG domain
MVEPAVWLHQGARITVAYMAVYVGMVVWQGRTRLQLVAEYAQKQRVFERYAGRDARMLQADRLCGNTNEWMPVFLTLLWLALAITHADRHCVLAGQVYVASRLLYAVLVASGHGIDQAGPRPAILLATLPGSAALLHLLLQIAYHAYILAPQ